MINSSVMVVFMGAAVLMAVSPGPNMVYLASRSLCQGRRAGVIAWIGVVAGVMVHMCSAVFGLTVLFMAVPYGYETLKIMGAGYLMWLAIQAFRSKNHPFAPQQLPDESAKRLFTMGFLTSTLNPKIAMFYLSVLPQFIDPHAGTVMAQSLILGIMQLSIAASVNLMVVLFAARISAGLMRRPKWAVLQRYIMGSVLAALATRLFFEQRRTP